MDGVGFGSRPSQTRLFESITLFHHCILGLVIVVDPFTHSEALPASLNHSDTPVKPQDAAYPHASTTSKSSLVLTGRSLHLFGVLPIVPQADVVLNITSQSPSSVTVTNLPYDLCISPFVSPLFLNPALGLLNS